METGKDLKGDSEHWDWTAKLSSENPRQDALGHAALQLVRDRNVKAIIVHTQTGGTALFLSKARPFCPILAFTPDPGAARRLHLFWGVKPVYAPDVQNREELGTEGTKVLLDEKTVHRGDKLVVVSGTSFGQVGAADAITVVTVK